MRIHLRSKDPIVRADQVLQRRAERATAAIARRDARDWKALLERIARKAVYKHMREIGYTTREAKEIAARAAKDSLPKVCEDCTRVKSRCVCHGGEP